METQILYSGKILEKEIYKKGHSKETIGLRSRTPLNWEKERPL